jgi:hypothetical protein
MDSQSKPTSKEVISKYAGLSNFMRNATDEDKKIVFTTVMRKVNEQQRQIIQKSQNFSEDL